MSQKKLTADQAKRLLYLIGPWPEGYATDGKTDCPSELPYGPIPIEPTTEVARIFAELPDDDPVRSLWKGIKPRTRREGVWKHNHYPAKPKSKDPDEHVSMDHWWADERTLQQIVQQLKCVLLGMCGVNARIDERYRSDF